MYIYIYIYIFFKSKKLLKKFAIKDALERVV